MGSVWSVFAVPASEIGKLPSAAAELELDEATLIVGPVLPAVGQGEAWVGFGFEHKGWRYIETATDDDLPPAFFGAFTRLVSLYGAGNSDSVVLSQYLKGGLRMQEETSYGTPLLEWMPALGLHLIGLSNWARFGVNPAELSGDTYPIDAVPPLDPAKYTAEPVSVLDKIIIDESMDALFAGFETGEPEAVVRYALACIQTREDLSEGMYMLEGVLHELPDGELKEAAQAWYQIVGR